MNFRFLILVSIFLGPIAYANPCDLAFNLSPELSIRAGQVTVADYFGYAAKLKQDEQDLRAQLTEQDKDAWRLSRSKAGMEYKSYRLQMSFYREYLSLKSDLEDARKKEDAGFVLDRTPAAIEAEVDQLLAEMKKEFSSVGDDELREQLEQLDDNLISQIESAVSSAEHQLAKADLFAFIGITQTDLSEPFTPSDARAFERAWNNTANRFTDQRKQTQEYIQHTLEMRVAFEMHYWTLRIREVMGITSEDGSHLDQRIEAADKLVDDIDQVLFVWRTDAKKLEETVTPIEEMAKRSRESALRSLTAEPEDGAYGAIPESLGMDARSFSMMLGLEENGRASELEAKAAPYREQLDSAESVIIVMEQVKEEALSVREKALDAKDAN